MKKLLLSLTASAFILSACGETDEADENTDEFAEAEDNSAVEELEARVAELEEENLALQEENNELAASTEETEEVDEVVEEEEEENGDEESSENQNSENEGTRSDPIVFGETAKFKATFTDRDANYEEFDAEVDVTIVETIRGEEAWEIISNENQFNDPAPDGKEYIINRIRIDMSNATTDDLKAHFSHMDFDYVSNSGSSYSSESAVIPDELRFELYNDGSSEGNIVGAVDPDDAPFLRYSNSFFFETE